MIPALILGGLRLLLPGAPGLGKVGGSGPDEMQPLQRGSPCPRGWREKGPAGFCFLPPASPHGDLPPGPRAHPASSYLGSRDGALSKAPRALRGQVPKWMDGPALDTSPSGLWSGCGEGKRRREERHTHTETETEREKGEGETQRMRPQSQRSTRSRRELCLQRHGRGHTCPRDTEGGALAGGGQAQPASPVALEGIPVCGPGWSGGSSPPRTAR